MTSDMSLLQEAKSQILGPLGDVCRNIIKSCCVPIFWFELKGDNSYIINNGTVTLVKTPKKIFGITAAHVLRSYFRAKKEKNVRLMLMNEVVDNIEERMIDISDALDLACFEVDEILLKKLGSVLLLESWPPRPPQEGKGIMLAGYPGIDRVTTAPWKVEFGTFTAIAIARTVTERQITWLIEHEDSLEDLRVRTLTPNYNLGGVSGGPLLGWFQDPIVHFKLSGIIVEHPNYEESNISIERVIAVRADFINDDGSISKLYL